MVTFTTPFDATTVEPMTGSAVSTIGMSAAAVSLEMNRFRNVPLEMREGHWWMVTRPNDKQPQKVIGKQIEAGGDWTNPNHHCSFATALEAIALDQSLNLMLMLGFGNDFVCIDVDPLEKVKPEHKDAARLFRGKIDKALRDETYAEVSMSGAGMHYIGRTPALTEIERGTHKAQHRDYGIDLLLRYGLVLTGDAQGDTNKLTNLDDETRQMLDSFRNFHSGAIAVVDAKITPAQCDEKRLIAILSSGKHGDAFRTGAGLHGGWSDVMTAVTNTAAEFSTDKQLTYRVLSRSGLVQLAESASNGELRTSKFNRLWETEWPKALQRTEQSRSQNALTKICRELTRADLWEQSLYVKHMVQRRAMLMISQGFTQATPMSADQLAPLFHYLTPERLNDLQDTLKKVREEYSQKFMEARFLMGRDKDTEVSELNAYLTTTAANEPKITAAARLKEYNNKYYILENHGGAAMVFENCFDPVSGAQRTWRTRAFCEAKASEQAYLGWNVEKDAPEMRPAPLFWTGSDKARRYVAQEMRYETTARTIPMATGEILNLFHGWATTPVAGAWDNIRYLIHDILCCSAPEASEYLLNYLAHMVQRPDKLPSTAIILQSEEQGTGKTTFMDVLRALLGARYCDTTADASTVVGQFNSSAMGKILLHLEEAVAPNDRSIESKVKALITNETMTYNAKGLAAVQGRNYARVFMTSNAQQVAHLARHDRRMFVLNVSPKHANDALFWGDAHRAYPQEREAFMHALQTRDISAYRPSLIPYTAAKDKQKIESVVGPDLVLRTFLEDGRLPTCSRFNGETWEVRVSALTDYFIKQQVKVGYKTPQPARVLKAIALGPVVVRRLTIGQDSRAFRVIALPMLPVARAQFLADQRIAAHDWGNAADDWALD
tara:strand:- start:5354 stop:8029 length:2676 start_codon:yes stop_codon:yes gene_type:complete